MSDSRPIYVGGWARFREESGATRKEVPEDFSWMGVQEIVGGGGAKFFNNSDRLYYEDCRDALARVSGAKEWLKDYVSAVEGSEFNFQDEIGLQIRLQPGRHSDGSWCNVMWAYKRLLNDWDGWVLLQKEYDALKVYKKLQAPSTTISRLYNDTMAVIVRPDVPYGPTSESVMEIAGQHGLSGTILEINSIVGQIYRENIEREEDELYEREEQAHRDLMANIKVKYMHPLRWFDTPDGSSVYPTTPYNITGRAIQEMENWHPEYRSHLGRVKAAMTEYKSIHASCKGRDAMMRFLAKWSLA